MAAARLESAWRARADSMLKTERVVAHATAADDERESLTEERT